MSRLVRVLISNTGLPSKKIGSWTNRISMLLKSHPGLFDFVFSPTDSPGDRFVFCKKVKSKPRFLLKFLGKSSAQTTAGEYFKALDRLCRSHQSIHLVVLDDLALLEAMAHWKYQHGPSKTRLDFSYHGHSFFLPDTWGQQVDRVFFLTESGYLDTLARNDVFAPVCKIVGNGTDSRVFFPLSSDQKSRRKAELGFREGEKILLWVSNPRPKKGLKLFMELGKKLLDRHSNLRVLIIGNAPDLQLPDDRWKAIGKVPNSELPNYLQAGDFYCFTSLWKEGFGLTMIEAAKCGNQVIASKNGGIPEVLSGLPGSHLVPLPNVIESWETAFESAWDQNEAFCPDPTFLRSFHSIQAWEARYLEAVTS